MAFKMDFKTESPSPKRDSFLLHPITRTLVSESSNLFFPIQELSQLNSFELQQEILNASKKYRCIIRECIQKLECCDNKSSDSSNYTSSLCDIFYTTELCWHLCEILYFEPMPGDIILPLLKEWIQFHFVNYESVAVKVIKYQASEDTSTGVDTESLVPDYWGTIYGLLCQGNSSLACKLVELHSKANTSMYTRAIKFLRYIPELHSSDNSQTVVQFENSWSLWRSQIKSDLDAGTYSSDKNLEITMKIVSGESSVDKVLRKQCASWYQYLIAKLLYTQPSIKSSQIYHYVIDSMKLYKVLENSELLNTVLRFLLKKDLLEITKGLLNMADNCWCATHLTNLLQIGQFIPRNLQTSETLDKKLVIGYGKFLIESGIYWEIGVLYLVTCNQEGFNVLKAVLPEIKIDNDYVAKKVLRIAKENNLSSVVQKVCTQRSEKYIELERYVDALAWAINGKNHDLASYLADIFLKNYLQTQEMPLLEVVEHFGPKALFVDRLMFLVKFVEYCNKKDRQEYSDGLSLLMDLLVNNMVPTYFKMTYFNEILTLLSTHSTEASRTDLVQILHSIEDYSNDFEAIPNKDDTSSKLKYEEFQKRINPLRKQVVTRLSLASLPRPCIK